jgi:hypothetical protein
MASPYFQNIQTKQADFSGYGDAGRAKGQGMAQTGLMIGGLLKQIGSAYFENEEAKSIADGLMQTDEFADMALSKGMSPFDIQQIQQDEKFRDKEGQKFIKQHGGAKEAIATYRATKKVKQEFETNQLRNNQLRQQTEFLGLQTQQLKEQTNLSKQKNSYLQFNSDPKQKSLTPLNRGQEWIKNVKEQGGDVASATQAMHEVNKAMRLGVYNPALLATLKQGMMKEERDGTQLTELNFLSNTEMQTALNKTILKLNLPQEQIDALTKQMESLVVPDGGIRKTAKEIAELVGFGEFEQTMDSMGDLRQTSTLIDSSLKMLQQNDGKWMPKVVNPVSASVSLIKLAKLAQGEGVLSNQDVDRIKGNKSYSAEVDRWFDKRIGSDYVLTSKDVGEGGQFYKGNSPMINPATGEEYEAGETIVFGGGDVSAEDLMFMKDVMNVLQEKFTENSAKYVPRIFKGVKARYGGLTLDEIDTQLGGMGEFLKGGLNSLQKNQAIPMKRDLDHALKAVKKNQSKQDFIERNTDNPTPEEIRRMSSAYDQAREQGLQNGELTIGQYDPAEYDISAGEIMDGMTGSNQPTDPKSLIKKTAEEQDRQVANIMSSVNKNVAEREESQRSGNQVKGVMAGGSFYGATKIAGQIQSNITNNRIANTDIFPDAEGQKIDKIPDGDRKLKKKINQGLKGDKLLKNVINQQLDQNVVKKKGVASATKALGKTMVKKIGAFAIGGLVSGGVGWVIGGLDMLNDISNFREEEIDNQINLIKSKQGNLSGKELEVSQALVAKLKFKKDNPRTGSKLHGIREPFHFGYR